MIPAHLHILRHSIGLDDNGHVKYGYKSSERNYYCTGPDCSGRADIMELEAAGLMKFSHHINDGTSEIFYVTDAGKVAALKDVMYPKLTKAQRRYRAFLRIDMGITFKDFLTNPYFKDARRSA